MVELTVRLVFSLAVVLGLLLLCAKVAGRRFQGRRDALVQVVHRQPISRNASVSVVTVGSRVLVLGSTDQQVRLLAELAADELDEATVEPELVLLRDPDEAPGPDLSPAEVLRSELAADPLTDPELSLALDAAATPGRRRAQPTGRHAAPRSGGARATSAEQGSALAGSLLSTRTWRDAWGAVTGRAS